MRQPTLVTAVDDNNPQVKAFVDAERRLFDHYRLSYQTHFIQLEQPQARVRVLEVGSGEPLVISPGGSGEAFTWVPLMSKLNGRKYILYDRPGGGLSDYVSYRDTDFRHLATQTLSKVLDEFGLKSAPIVGNSMGGLWSFWLATDSPERVSKIAQVGCPALILNSSAPLPMRLLSVPVIGRRVVRLSVPKSKETASQGLHMVGSSPEQIARLPQVFSETFFYSRHLPNYQMAWRTLNERVLSFGITRSDVRTSEVQLSKIGQPVLFIWGLNDPFGDVKVGERAAKVMPNATLKTLPAGHLPYLDESEECAQLLREFLS